MFKVDVIFDDSAGETETFFCDTWVTQDGLLSIYKGKNSQGYPITSAVIPLKNIKYFKNELLEEIK